MPKAILAPDPKPTMVYVFVAQVPHRLVKIGISGDLESRRHIIELNLASGATCEVFFFLPLARKPDALRVERAAHQDHAAQRVKGEWFDIEPEDAKASILRHSESLPLASPPLPKPPKRRLVTDFPQCVFRVPKEYHEVIKQVGQRLREESAPYFAARLAALLEGAPIPPDIETRLADMDAKIEALLKR